MSKLNNSKAVRELLAGEHKTQTRKTFSFGEAFERGKLNQKLQEHLKKDGDTYTHKDEDGKPIAVYEKKGTRIIKHHQNWSKEAAEEKRRFAEEYRNWKYSNCLHDECKTKAKTRLDENFSVIYQMCADCATELELKLKIDGIYDEFIKSKMYANAKAKHKDEDIELRNFIEQVTSDPGYVNSDGSIDQWRSEFNPEGMIEEYEEFKQQVFEKLKPEEENFHMRVLKEYVPILREKYKNQKENANEQ